jgi:glycosyltransferase involved in cell wall biosynthesis
MPTYDQAAFIRRAVESLCAQTVTDWELIIIDDGSPADTARAIEPLLSDARLSYVRLAENRGHAAAINEGLRRARAPIIAYLPSDDVYHPEHLATLLTTLATHPEAVLAYAGVRYHYNRYTEGLIEGYCLQPVQVAHRRGVERWTEREELVSDDHERIFWAKLRPRGTFVGSGQISCEWVRHPGQLHRLIREQDGGGINPFRARFNIAHPLRFHSSHGNFIDEVTHYRRYRERPDTPLAVDGLKILLVGELAYNADRVLALEERGHQLYGLWTNRPAWFNTVGPLPFGHVTDLSRQDWRDAARRIRPDIIYAQLNWQTVEFCHAVLQANPGIPFVWHFKEGPFICIEHGLWPHLLELYERADGQIYSSPELYNWFETTAPGLTRRVPSLVLDGDLPKAEWLRPLASERLSQRDGAIHTVVPGRPIGLHPHTVGELAAQRIHLHFYGDFTQGLWKSWIEKAHAVADGHLHLHGNVDQDRWSAEFSQYDAGWLHFFASRNGGDLRRVDWDDLNYPARIATMALAGLPLIQQDNGEAVVASQNLARQHDIGLFVRDMADLRQQLCDAPRMERLRANMVRVREQFTFDYHADRLIAFFRTVLEAKT